MFAQASHPPCPPCKCWQCTLLTPCWMCQFFWTCIHELDIMNTPEDHAYLEDRWDEMSPIDPTAWDNKLAENYYECCQSYQESCHTHHTWHGC